MRDAILVVNSQRWNISSRRHRLAPRGAYGAVVHTTKDWHPPRNELVDFAIGKLDPLREAMIEHHAQGCDLCAAIIAEVPADNFVTLLRASSQAAPISSDASDQQVPSLLSNHPRYRVKRLLARGGMGLVYLAEHKLMQTQVALKVADLDGNDSSISTARLLQEARTAGSLAHPSIARLLDAEQIDQSVVLCMEFVRGKTLAAIVAERGPLSVTDACRCIRRIAVGLDYANQQGVVHRDIKPQNIMLSSDGQIKILDFGLGRFTCDQASHSGLTADKQMLGTPSYVAPEQARDAKRADIRSDIYSLGCVFYFLLSGQPPFQSKKALKLIEMHEKQPAPDIRKVRPEVPEALANLIARMLAKKPSSRPQSPKILVGELDRLMREGKADTSRVLGIADSYERFLTPAILLPVLTVIVSCAVLLLF